MVVLFPAMSGVASSHAGRRRRRLTALALAAWLFAFPLQAVEKPGLRQQVVVSGDGIPSAGSGKREGVLAETIYLSGERVRVDFDAGPCWRGRVLRDATHAWLQWQDARQPVPADGFRVGAMTRLDPVRPCWEPGLSCGRTDNRLVAGRSANGWRYRYAGHKGPFGTDQGVLWVDAETGLLLAFDGRDPGGHRYRMETVSLERLLLDEALFAGPDSAPPEPLGASGHPHP
ncbi:hypothetical protein [Frateuria defendens]|uniref:hypothetical protein n=1 Tax=Frateuria defendens TaxID=2219559 RepID=UPI00069F0965|nr:hypothetical protein [Frateuria defendens]